MSFEERVARLERSIRWWKRCTLLLFAGVVLAAGFGAAAAKRTVTADRIEAKEVVADKISIVDDKGRTYVILRHYTDVNKEIGAKEIGIVETCQWRGLDAQQWGATLSARTSP